MKYRFFVIPLSLVLILTAIGCTARVAETGDTVTVDYTLTLDDGSVHYSTSGASPAEYHLGQNQLIEGFEEALIGMRVGESKTVTIPVDKAYGPVRPELIQEVSRTELREGFVPTVGGQLQSTLNGVPVTVTIREVTETTVTVDANHVLAGQNLTFEVELLSIEGTENSGGLSEIYLVTWILGGVVILLAGAFLIYFLRTRRILQTSGMNAASRYHDKDRREGR